MDRATLQYQIMSRGIANPAVLDALRAVRREYFLPEEIRSFADEDAALSIGHGQTISQPYIVALMTELLDPQRTDRILEIGTGSGYQTAILAEIVKEVYTVEIIKELSLRARRVLGEIGYSNIHFLVSDGYSGWPEEAPFDGIIVTAAPSEIPKPLISQLNARARLVIPVGGLDQRLEILEKKEDGSLEGFSHIAVRFVPMTGEALKQER